MLAAASFAPIVATASNTPSEFSHNTATRVVEFIHTQGLSRTAENQHARRDSDREAQYLHTEKGAWPDVSQVSFCNNGYTTHDDGCYDNFDKGNAKSCSVNSIQTAMQ
jgi:hypothetical protein